MLCLMVAGCCRLCKQSIRCACTAWPGLVEMSALQEARHAMPGSSHTFCPVTLKLQKHCFSWQLHTMHISNMLLRLKLCPACCLACSCWCHTVLQHPWASSYQLWALVLLVDALPGIF